MKGSITPVRVWMERLKSLSATLALHHARARVDGKREVKSAGLAIESRPCACGWKGRNRDADSASLITPVRVWMETL